VFESFSRPSRFSEIDPPTSVIPCVRAHSAIAATDSPPSSGSAAAYSSSTDPIAFHFSGSATTSAPVAAARATRRSACSRFAALSARLVICTQATRRRSVTR
jgi:hypothetical protein